MEIKTQSFRTSVVGLALSLQSIFFEVVARFDPSNSRTWLLSILIG
nr:hypothetical protein [Listeria valentina]